MTRLTSSVLYNYIQCPHRVWRDLYGPLDEKAPEENPFVELLWQKGVMHEEKVAASLGEYVDLSAGSRQERLERTLEHLKKGSPLIYQGVLKSGELSGVPDLLERAGDGSYIPADIKSGLGLEGVDDDIGGGRLKKHYAVQLCLYLEILGKLGFAGEDRGYIIDIRGSRVPYELDAPRGPRTPGTWLELYGEVKRKAWALIENREKNTPAMSGICKLCRWYSSCRRWCEAEGDLSLVFSLGRKKRDALRDVPGIGSLEDFGKADLGWVLERKKEDRNFLRGMGEKTIKRLSARAKMLSGNKKPEVYQKLGFPEAETEFFFDIEDDPTRDFVYLHGLYRRSESSESFVYFFAVDPEPEEEKVAWSDFWDFIRKFDLSRTAVYYYSPHEKTVYRKLREKYPDVAAEEELEDFFLHENVIDLYGMVCKNTDWPLSSYSVKDIAGYLGFKWRDSSPSGVLSIQWFNEYLEKRDPGIFQRIIEYNEDDCKATMVLKDGMKKLSEETFGG